MSSDVFKLAAAAVVMVDLAAIELKLRPMGSRVVFTAGLTVLLIVALSGVFQLWNDRYRDK